MGDEGVRDRIKSMRVEENIESDHQSLEVWAKGERERGKRKKRTMEYMEWRRVQKEKIRGIKLGEKEMEEGWKEIERKIKEVLEETEKEQERTFGWNRRKEKGMRE